MVSGHYHFLIFAVMAALFSHHVLADTNPDYDREQRIAEQIEPQVFDGEVVWLHDGARDFLAIHTEADSPSGSVIVLHGRDVSPEDQNVAGPVRVALAEQGWSTLAIQMPVLEKGKTYYDYLPVLSLAIPRIEAAVQFLRQRGEDIVVVAAHSCGAHMANNWLNLKGDQSIDGYIAIGLGATDANQDLQTPFPIGKMSIPVLDIYGAEEFPRPLAMVDERHALLEQNGNPGSKQVMVDGADHYFTDAGDRLAEHLVSWLNATTFSK